MKKLTLLLVNALFALPSFATDFEYYYEGKILTYTILDDKTCGTKEGANYEPGNTVSGYLIIPEKVYYEGEAYSVVEISADSFINCPDLRSVSMPNSVTSIGRGAFYGCTSLKSIEIPNSVTEIDYDAFKNCSGLTSITIGSSVTSIGNGIYNKGVFEDCSSLKEVHISDLTAWCEIDFSADTANPLYYAHHLFLNGEEIKELIFPNSVTSIGKWAFYGCSGLTSVEIPNSVTQIGNYAFAGCSSLKEVHISDLTAWCEIDFSADTANPLYYAHHLFLNGEEIKELIFPNSVTSIGKWAFYGCSGLTSVEIPNSVTQIGNYAFAGCSGLTSITIGNSVTEIGEQAFAGCSGLTSITIGNSVTEIGEQAFAGCSKLLYIIVPPSVTSVEDNAFSRCDNLVKSAYPNSLSANPFPSGVAIKYPAKTTAVVDNVIYDTRQYMLYFVPVNLTDFTIPETVKYIEDNAFYGCDGMITLKVESTNPPSVTRESFDEEMYSQTTLIVPEGSEPEYHATSIWDLFYNIETYDPNAEEPEVGINNVEVSENEPVEVYNLSGVKVGNSLEGLAKGVYVVRQGSKTTKVAI